MLAWLYPLTLWIWAWALSSVWAEMTRMVQVGNIFTLPVKMMRSRSKHQFVSQEIMVGACHCFHKEVRQLILNSNMCKINSFGNMLTDEMAVHFNMIGSLMKDRIVGNSDNTCIITKEGSKSHNKNSQLMEKTTKPNKFTGGRGHGSILSLG